MANIYDKILRDARVKLTSMFDNNFRDGLEWRKRVIILALLGQIYKLC